MVETEDDDKREQRLAMEKRSREDIKTLLEDKDKDWSERRLCSRDKADKKRGRIPVLIDDEQKPKRRKRMKYSLLGDDWGAEEDGDSAQAGGGILLLMFHLLQNTLVRRGWRQSRRMEATRRLGWGHRRTS